MIQLIYGSKSYINFDLLIPLINITMSDILNKISDVFRNYINYDTVNNFSDKKLRNARIPLVDFISFRFLYIDKMLHMKV